jgi:hypothetical protein
MLAVQVARVDGPLEAVLAPRHPASTTRCSALKNGRALGQSGRFAQLEPALRRSFDVPATARLSVGSSWPGLVWLNSEGEIT